MATSPAEARSTPVDGIDVIGALSPSRINDFMRCPLMYRFRSIDRLPEPQSAAAVKGTLVHKVLEQLFDLPTHDRILANTLKLLDPAWSQLQDESPEVLELFGPEGSVGAAGITTADWLAQARSALEIYFTLEDPQRLNPENRELYVEAILESRVLLRGFIDRLDVAPTGEIRIVDYKTGKAPRSGYESQAFFQLKVYALVLWRIRQVVPARLQLVFLGSGEILTYDPSIADLEATERKVNSVWDAMQEAVQLSQWSTRRTKLCDWCSFQSLCPEFGGTPPALPL